MAEREEGGTQRTPCEWKRRATLKCRTKIKTAYVFWKAGGDDGSYSHASCTEDETLYG